MHSLRPASNGPGDHAIRCVKAVRKFDHPLTGGVMPMTDCRHAATACRSLTKAAGRVGPGEVGDACLPGLHAPGTDNGASRNAASRDHTERMFRHFGADLK